MMFRRFLERFRRHQWGAIATELTIVVLGVFIGMQVSNWNQQREINQKAAVFTAHLKADLRHEDWRLQMIIAYSREVRANAERAIAALDSGVNIDDEDLLVSAYRASQYVNDLRARATYDELISTGSIALIRDQDLRDKAMAIYNNDNIDNVVEEGKLSQYREAFRMGLPIEVQRALAKHCGDQPRASGDYAGIPDILGYPCSSGLSGQIVRDAVDSLRSNPAIVPALRLRIINLDTRIFNLTGFYRQSLGGLRDIAEEKP